MRRAERRQYAGRAGTSFCAARPNSFAVENFLAERPIIRPPALRAGDKIGVVAPASSFSRQGFEAGCERLRTMGYEPVYSPDIFDRDLYFAGTAERRTRELIELWHRDDIAALVCVRGGYGSNYVLEQLGIDHFAARPKALIGCSAGVRRS